MEDLYSMQMERYFPDPDFTGPDQFTFIVTDAQEGIYTVIVNVLVYPEGEE